MFWDTDGAYLSSQVPSSQSNEMDQGHVEKDANGGSLFKKGKGASEGGLGLVSCEKDRHTQEPLPQQPPPPCAFVNDRPFVPALSYM